MEDYIIRLKKIRQRRIKNKYSVCNGIYKFLRDKSFLENILFKLINRDLSVYDYELIDTIYEDILSNSFEFNYIEFKYVKFKGNMVLNKIPKGIDKNIIIEKCIHRILSTLFDNFFSNVNINIYSIHSNLEVIMHKWKDIYYLATIDLADILHSSMSHNNLIKILKIHIDDNKFIKLILNYLRIGKKVIQKNKYGKKVFNITKCKSGTLYKNSCIFYLFNIYLIKLDEYICDLKLFLFKKYNNNQLLYYNRFNTNILIGLPIKDYNLVINIEKCIVNFFSSKLLLDISDQVLFRDSKLYTKYNGFIISNNDKLYNSLLHNLYIGADIYYILNLLSEYNFCDKNKDYFPISKASIINWSDEEIVQKFNTIYLRIIEYYSCVFNKIYISRIRYILRFGLAKTLAHKHKSSCTKMFKKHGKYLEGIGGKLKFNINSIDFNYRAKPFITYLKT